MSSFHSTPRRVDRNVVALAKVTAMSDEEIRKKVEPALKLKFLSHGTLESVDLEQTRRFYEEFLGLEVVKVSNVSLWCRLGGNHIYVVVLVKPERKTPMPFLFHNGLDVETEEDVDECHRVVVREAE